MLADDGQMMTDGQTMTSCLLLPTLSGTVMTNMHDWLCNYRDVGHLKPPALGGGARCYYHLPNYRQ